ncbi:MAG TPA: transporter [Pyrinomonadaceae bacterium]|nr:transporter [Pyrinomonadaceae bacterium]
MKLTRLIQLCLAVAIASTAAGQEMEPRAYSPAPVGTQFVLLSYGYQSGDVLLDSSLPLKDVSINLNAASLGYGRTLNLLGRQANVAVVVPYIWGTARGTVLEDQVNVRRSGGGDVRVRFSTLIKGGEARSAEEFAGRKPSTIIGASISIIVPTGQYDPARLVNPGSNRWAFKPEMGISKPKGRWTFEANGGAWLFSANNSFLGTSRREQKPMMSLQGGVIYTLRPRMWISGNATFYTGGSTVLNDIENADRQKNARVGATFSLPLNQRQSFKVVWARGVTTRIGGHLNTIAVAWQYAWSK